MKTEIEIVRDKKQRKEFFLLPYSLYRDDPLWIAPLRTEQKKLFDPAQNAFLQHCRYQLFLARHAKKLVGRIAVFIDHSYVDYWKEDVGFFGSFECVQNPVIAAELLTTAQRWLIEHGQKRMRGPISFEAQNWGCVFEGFDSSPRLMSPYNPPYYNEMFCDFGLKKIKDLEVFAGKSDNYRLPERFNRHRDRLIQKYKLTIRHLQMKYLIRDVRTILDLTNRALGRNWGFVPVSVAEAEGIARDLKSIVHPELVLIIEADGQPVGFSIALPDIFQIIKGLNGRLFPLGIFRLIFRLKTVSRYRMWALGIVPEYQRRGIDTLLYLETYKILSKRSVDLEANYVLEDNYAMKDAILKLGLKKVRTIRIYQKEIET
jgi:ribosomal protein S18 acetylase RimI-like enzyme